MEEVYNQFVKSKKVKGRNEEVIPDPKGCDTLRPLCDTIEAFIKELMEEERSQIELKRNELAEYFRCAPSQINYVLATRFTPDHGYLIESRRGGGGYIRIIRVTISDQGEQLLQLINRRLATPVAENEAQAIIDGLRQQGVVDAGEARLMRAAVGAGAIALPINIKDALRADILRAMLLTLVRQEQEQPQTE